MIAIAVDGPASSGKGTVARRVAQLLDYQYVDTGAMYRTVGLLCLRQGVDVRDAAASADVARHIDFAFAFREGALVVYADGEDVSTIIRGEAVGAAASAVAVHPPVRSALLGLQRALGAAGRVVMDGRDIGTVVLPRAQLKIYLDASLDERARRRHAELPGRSYADVRAELAARDAQDMGRASAPLCAAADAVHLDSTRLSIDAVVAEVVRLARERGA
ncbi:MAG: (d)CMP kinase [Deltaproteobacteria bacterium]|nr:(d)CMP kinase [Deltaproteobacteria bacterium]